MPRPPRKHLQLVVVLALVAGVAIPLLLVPRPRTHVFAAIFNGSHVLIGALLTLGVLGLLGSWWPIAPRRRRYVVAWAATLVAGAALELAQFVAPGQPSLADLVRDVAGGVAGLLVHAALVAPRRRDAIGWGLAALVVMAPGVWPAVSAVRLQWAVDGQLPAVAAFEGAGAAARMRSLDGGVMVVTAAPHEWTEAARPRVGRVTFTAEFRNPRVLIDNPFANWGGHRALVFTLYSPEPAPFLVILRIDDMDATTAMSDRFHRELTVVPGHNAFRIPLDDVRLSPGTRELDLGALENVVLFMERPERDHTLYLDRFWLEG